MSKVVSLNGDPLNLPGEPDEDIVAVLERHLADAKAGNTIAVAVASVDRNGWVLSSHIIVTHRFSLAGAVANILHQINCSIDAELEQE